MRTKNGKFKSPYTKKIIINYLKAVKKITDRPPTYRDLKKIPGPSPRTIVRHFGKWSLALKAAGIRPHTQQLMKGEKTYIRQNWRKMTDKEIGLKLGLSIEVIKYYRMNYNLWKNRKGTSKQKHKADGMKIYGKNCEVCNISITELHHIKSKSTNPKDWSILCPTCHAVITRGLVKINSRRELKTILKPYIQKLHKKVKFS